MRSRHLAALSLVALAACLGLAGCGKKAGTAAPQAAASGPMPAASEVVGEMKEVLAAHRQIIVLFADEKKQTEAQRTAADDVGQAIFHANREHVDKAEAQFAAIAGSGDDPTPALAPVLDYVESDPSLFDADRLAFRDLLASLQVDVARNQTLGAIRLHKRIGDDIDALDEIEKNYDAEIRAIFSRFEQRAIVQKRERWDDYVKHLGTLYTRDQILKAHGVVLATATAATPPPAPSPEPKPLAAGKPETGPEIFGTGLPPKVVALTFDDGPHPIYTAEITAILKQYGAPGTFFEVGNNLGKVDADGTPHLSRNAEISRQLLAEGYVVGNHSMTHAQLSKKTGDALKIEILDNDKLLKAIDPDRPPLFRFPYGARNAEGKEILAKEHLTSVLWNVDSMDWADPIPNSIADRVMREIDRNGRGIVLFHDIHERTVKALPLVMSRLVAEGYQFAGWDGKTFAVMKPGETRGFVDVPQDASGAAPAASAAASMAAVSDTTTEGDSWAVVIGIDDYAHWPKLGHAVRDAESVKSLLVARLGFKADHVISLQNQSATRTNVMAAFNQQLPKSGLKKTDNLFVFFAGHGGTRHLSSGRDLGYIIPVDAGTDDLAGDAIPMTELQNISEALVARHVIFVMDACYSGLGLVRGGGASTRSGNFLRDNAHRRGPPDAHGRRRRPDGGRWRPGWSLHLHVDTAAGPVRQGRPQRRQHHHRHRARGLHRAGGGLGIRADTGLRQPARLRGRRVRVHAGGQRGIHQRRHAAVAGGCHRAEHEAGQDHRGRRGERGHRRRGREGPAGQGPEDRRAHGRARQRPPTGTPAQRPRHADVQGEELRVGA